MAYFLLESRTSNVGFVNRVSDASRLRNPISFVPALSRLALCRDMNTEHLIQARYEVLMKEKEVSESGDNQVESSLLNKDMEGALDSFDNLFCRRCLVSSYLISQAKFSKGYYLIF